MNKSQFREVKINKNCVIYNEDCLKILKNIDQNSIDSIVCDPPYGINVLKNEWDKSLPSQEIWHECFRVLKPGGHILAFSSARLYHHLAVAMENAGFETFNMLVWVYSSGFPKGKNLSREFDKKDGIPLPDDKFRKYLRTAIKKSGYKIVELEKICDARGMFCHYLGKSQPVYPNKTVWDKLKKVLSLDSTYDEFFTNLQKKREELREKKRGRDCTKHLRGFTKDFDEYLPKSKLAKKWNGWFYGKQTLKPCLEPIYFGQKPPLRPLTENIKRWSVGALNIGDCHYSNEDGKIRYPGNFLFENGSFNDDRFLRFEPEVSPCLAYSKASLKERKNNPHPTVKPIELLKHLVTLVTPPGGVCLDPFMGSGTTGAACLDRGHQFIGIEKEQEYFEISERRLLESSSELRKRSGLDGDSKTYSENEKRVKNPEGN